MQMLRDLFGHRAVIPGAVEQELRIAAHLGHAPSAQVLIGRRGILRTIRLEPDQAIRAQRLRASLPEKKGGSSENLGEAEAIILAQDQRAGGASVLVIDDGDGAIAALGRGVNTLGSVWVLGFAAVMGVQGDDDAWDIYERLVASGMGIPESGWQPGREGEQRFRDVLGQWRSAISRDP